jgi:hypothetical protein
MESGERFIRIREVQGMLDQELGNMAEGEEGTHPFSSYLVSLEERIEQLEEEVVRELRPDG